ncbi:hypothetical protein ACFYVL_40210 [Streptomyces sp. NPDC004111]|uniref:hypothetical protein n=1 Tax=Streptomyces sp. NPDC004111 TaxID=3364690 RepID=UPI0036AE46E6
MSGAPARVGRNYTAARRHPWVLGRVGEWKLPFGPYTPIQLTVAFVGAFTLIKTVDWWAPVLGPIPIVGWGVAVWAVRGARVAGREPVSALLGWISMLTRPHAGRINGRTARDRTPRTFRGGFVIEAAPGEQPGGVASPAPATRRPATQQAAAARRSPPPRRRPSRATGSPRPTAARPQSRPGSRTAPAPSPSPASSSVAAPLSPLHQRLATAAASTSSSTSRSSS